MSLASCLSPNRDIVIAAIGIGTSEGASHWKWFVVKLLEANSNLLKLDAIVISVREKGLSTAVAEVLPGVPHGYCSFHIKKNVRNAFKTDLNGLVDTIAKFPTQNKYQGLLNDCAAINRPAAEYLKGDVYCAPCSGYVPRTLYLITPSTVSLNLCHRNW